MEKVKIISLRYLADRVIEGDFGNGDERKKKLGNLYPIVQNIVNEKVSCSKRHPVNDSLIEQVAKNALKGVFGSIEERKTNLDYIYPRVQAKIIEIVQEELKSKTIREIVEEVIQGKYGNGMDRKDLLGDLYKIIQNEVNILLGFKKRYELDERSKKILFERIKNGEFENEKEENFELDEKTNEKEDEINNYIDLSIEVLANKVIRGEFGKGQERKDKLGELYPIVQNRVNEMLNNDFRNDINLKSIEILAERVMKGEFGNGIVRRQKLGELYPFVQNKVNEILGNSTVYEEKPIPDYIKIYD